MGLKRVDFEVSILEASGTRGDASEEDGLVMCFERLDADGDEAPGLEAAVIVGSSVAGG